VDLTLAGVNLTGEGARPDLKLQHDLNPQTLHRLRC
jgi:hypothetical protein